MPQETPDNLFKNLKRFFYSDSFNKDRDRQEYCSISLMLMYKLSSPLRIFTTILCYKLLYNKSVLVGYKDKFIKDSKRVRT